jgi:hypothetical protein
MSTAHTITAYETCKLVIIPEFSSQNGEVLLY